ncbi:MAG: hemolysin family protein [Planctomycetia bacterium]|nr:hemolysin family protein [Planctomycetia bacterium]
MDQSLYIAAAVCLLATLCASWAARSLHHFSRSRLEELCRQRNRRDLLGEVLLRHEEVALAVDCWALVFGLLTVLCFVSAHWLRHLEGAADAPLGGTAWGLDLAACVVALLFARLWLPEALARLWAEPLLVRTWPFWLIVSSLARPLTLGGELINALLHRLAGRVQEVPSAASIEEEIRTILTEGHREGLLEEEAREMIEGVIELRDCEVSQVMTPRTEMLCISVHLDWPETLLFVNQAGHTRIPAYDKSRDDVVGVLFIKDMLPELAKENPRDRKPMLEILRKAYFVPETKQVNDLLQEFQVTRNHMAVVLDEYGGVSGLVTIEDVLEEIVGEIVDEHDEALVEGIRVLNDRACEALARVHIDEINEQLHTRLPDDEEFDTIGGFVFHELGRIPARGEQVVWQNVRITVIDVSRRRIERVRVEIMDPAGTTENDECGMMNDER